MCKKNLNPKCKEKKAQPVFIVDEADNFQQNLCDNLTQKYLNLNIFGKDLNLVISFNDKQIKPHQIIPLAQTICDKIVTTAKNEAEMLGYKIPCKKYCSKCCKNLVPVSVAEAIWRHEEIKQLPLGEQKILRRSMELAQRKLLAAKPPKFDEQNIEQQVSDWYADLDITCPFLADNICTIYQERPLACREHLVTGENCCTDLDNQTNQVFALPVSILEAMAQLCKDMGEYETEAIMLPVSMRWAAEMKDDNAKTYYISELLDRLINIIIAQAKEKNPVMQMS